MANPAYPSLPIAIESVRTLRDGRQEAEGADGKVRIRKIYADKYDFQLVHPALTAAQLATLTSFYGTYGASDIDLTYDGTVYTVRFGKGAIQTSYVSPTLRKAVVRLVGV